MTHDADQVSGAYLDAMEILTRTAPDAHFERAANGSAVVISGVPVPALNGILATHRASEVDLAEVATLAKEMPRFEVPWSIQFPGEPTPQILEVAAGLGRPVNHGMMVMTRPGPTVADAAEVSRIDGTRAAEYLDALAAGFGVPPAIFQRLAAPAMFDAAGVTGYLREADGGAVATGLGIRTGGWTGIFNIATRPDHRGRGYASAVTRAALADGYASGAAAAYLLCEPEVAPVYRSVGFVAAGHWTMLLPAG
ncbi:GNAT family N-acetyltransferase [Jidongwangia harbinensis]|uniref:GNAT family N-acetyltransferase n=1 Tax=Jidongwangia harbinensis TaxID=2878561 RepID=UPI001CD95530|nr:GNAT family N-acetyltransferase [Jidongwangia harbinensis]MCA2211521.1 GNAT family N-acetyltransferase [Jidongwangia harbinensis]